MRDFAEQQQREEAVLYFSLDSSTTMASWEGRCLGVLWVWTGP